MQLTRKLPLDNLSRCCGVVSGLWWRMKSWNTSLENNSETENGFFMKPNWRKNALESRKHTKKQKATQNAWLFFWAHCFDFVEGRNMWAVLGIRMRMLGRLVVVALCIVCEWDKCDWSGTHTTEVTVGRCLSESGRMFYIWVASEDIAVGSSYWKIWFLVWWVAIR